MNNTKHRFELYSCTDYTGIAEHLSKMAEKGWLLEKISNFGWTYQRIPPKRMKFFVSYYPKASAFDPEPTEEQRTFHDFCEHTGWLLAATSAQMQIFYNEQENPVPVETDPVLEVETIHKVAKKSYLPAFFVLLAISVMYGSTLISRLIGNPVDTLSISVNLLSCFIWTMVFLGCITELCGYAVWHSKAKKAAERGEFIESLRLSRQQRFILAIAYIVFAYWLITNIMFGSAIIKVVSILLPLYAIALFVLVNAVKQLLKRRKVSKDINRIVTFLSSFVLSAFMMGAIIFGILLPMQNSTFEQNRATYESPLTVADLLDVEYDDYNQDQISNESFLLGKYEVWQQPGFRGENFLEMPGLSYTIIEVKLPLLYDICKEYFLKKRNDGDDAGIPEEFKQAYEVQDASLWSAHEAYRLMIGHDRNAMNYYLLCYKNRIVEIIFDWEPTAEQMAIVGEKLAGDI